jgi:hypothetical protein
LRAVRVGSRVGAAEESGVLAIRGWLPLRKSEYWQRMAPFGCQRSRFLSFRPARIANTRHSSAAIALGVPFGAVVACISTAGLRLGDRRQPRSKKRWAGRDTCPGDPVPRSVVVTFVLRPSTAAKAVVSSRAMAASS